VEIRAQLTGNAPDSASCGSSPFASVFQRADSRKGYMDFCCEQTTFQPLGLGVLRASVRTAKTVWGRISFSKSFSPSQNHESSKYHLEFGVLRAAGRFANIHPAPQRRKVNKSSLTSRTSNLRYRATNPSGRVGGYFMPSTVKARCQ